MHSSLSGLSSTKRHTDVIVVGAGVLGTFHAYFAAQKGYKTLFPELFRASGLRVCKLQMMQTVVQERVLTHSILSGLSILRYPAFWHTRLLKSVADVPALFG